MNNAEFWKAAGIRAFRTFLQVILAVWTAGQLITEVDWRFLLLSAFSSAVYSMLTSILRNSIQSAKTRSGADCGSDHELFIAKFRLKLKKVGKTTRPFRYDLNQILYDSTVEVRNRFKGLDLIDRVPDELWNEVRDIVQ